MATAFADFQAQQDAVNTVQLNVVKYCWMLCDALLRNYRDYAIRGHQKFIDDADTHDYHKQQIEKLQQDIYPVNFLIESGRKYHKIVFVDGGGHRSVHCFVDKKTGEVYKSASWKSPAKGVRFNLNVITEREWLFEHADWSGGYLYRR